MLRSAAYGKAAPIMSHAVNMNHDNGGGSCYKTPCKGVKKGFKKSDKTVCGALAVFQSHILCRCNCTENVRPKKCCHLKRGGVKNIHSEALGGPRDKLSDWHLSVKYRQAEGRLSNPRQICPSRYCLCHPLERLRTHKHSHRAKGYPFSRS